MAKQKTAVNGQHPTPANVWRKAREEGEIITLPSGNVARLRPVPLDLLIISGGIPDLLTPIAAKTLWVEQDPEAIGNATELAEGFAKLVNIIVPLAFLEPRVVEEPGEGEISLDDIEFSDKVAVFNLATAGAFALGKFREEQARSLAALRNGQSDSGEAE